MCVCGSFILIAVEILHFFSTLTNWEASELVVLAKHRSTFGRDKVIGVAVVSGAGLTEDDNHNLSLNLCSNLPVSDMGQAVLNVLSARTYFDEFAKEFVALKTSQRSAVSSEEQYEAEQQQPQQQEKHASSKSSGKSSGKSSKSGGLFSGLLK